jgi:LuxR family maltose regulon positive regulatory protein
VSRPRLIERLNKGLQGNLTLISAPAGFGKTTLLSEWIRNLRTTTDDLKSKVADNGKIADRVAWLSLDRGDNDLVRFLTYLIAALQTIEDTLGEEALGMLHTAQPRPPPTELILTTVINEVTASPQDFVLVLDDYHVIESSPIDQALTFLLDHLPPPPGTLHLVIASRTDPSLPLARLRAGGHMTELRADDLRFTLDEISTFLNNVMGLDLSPENVAALEARTEGWIAGLQLAALSMQGREVEQITDFINSFTGSNRYVIDYLADEVLGRRPQGTKNFLLQTSILDRLTAPLCDAVTEQSGAHSQSILETLEAANLFIVPLDDERRWYRYHHLFADLLRSRLETTQPDLVSTLHRRASAWYAHNDMMSAAIAHSLAAEDFDRAAQLTEQTFFDRMSRGEDFATMLARLEALPDEILRARPRLGVMYAWMLAITLRLDAVEPRLQEVERMAGDQLQADLQLQIAHIRAELARHRGDYATAIERSHQVLEALPEKLSGTDLQTLTGSVANLGWAYLAAGDMAKARQWLSESLTIFQQAGTLTMTVLTLRGLCQVHELQGQLYQAAETCRQALQITDEAAQQSGQPVPATAYIYLGLGDLFREWNELDEADHHFTQGLAIGRQWQIGGDTLRDGFLCQARLKQAQGDLVGALDAIRQAQKLVPAYQSVPGFGDPIAACRAQLRLIQAASAGDAAHLQAVEQWLETRALNVDGPIDSLNDEREHLIWARLLIAQNEACRAIQLLDHLLQAAEDAGRTGRVIEILILQALARQALGDTEQALMTIKRALSLAEPEGHIRLFVDEGKPMAKLLRHALRAARGLAQDYVTKLLAAFPDFRFSTPAERSLPVGLRAGASVSDFGLDPSFKVSPKSKIKNPKSEIVESLSERELEVLRLIAAGLTNQEIAETLIIAVGTAKTHTAHIYAKLDVHNRTQAVARARELDLL